VTSIVPQHVDRRRRRPREHHRRQHEVQPAAPASAIAAMLGSVGSRSGMANPPSASRFTRSACRRDHPDNPPASCPDCIFEFSSFIGPDIGAPVTKYDIACKATGPTNPSSPPPSACARAPPAVAAPAVGSPPPRAPTCTSVETINPSIAAHNPVSSTKTQPTMRLFFPARQTPCGDCA